MFRETSVFNGDVNMWDTSTSSVQDILQTAEPAACSGLQPGDATRRGMWAVPLAAACVDFYTLNYCYRDSQMGAAS